MGKQVSKRDYTYYYTHYARMDTTTPTPFFIVDDWEAKILKKFDSLSKRFEENSAKPEYVTFLLGDSVNTFPFRVPLRNKSNYIERDTIITNIKYNVQVFKTDTIEASGKKIFIGALRADKFSVYYFDKIRNQEKLVMDVAAISLHLIGKLAQGTITVFSAFAELGSAAKKEIRTGATKGLAFGLANLMFIFCR